MERDRGILPIEGIEKTLRVKPIGRIRLFKRPEYMPDPKKKHQAQQENQHAEEDKEKSSNHASHSAGAIGVTIDYKA